MTLRSLVLSLLVLAATAAAQLPPGLLEEEGDDFNLGILGATAQPLSRDEASALGLDRKAGGLRLILVLEPSNHDRKVGNHFPAFEAGLRSGDIITATAAGPILRKGDPVLQLVEVLEAVEAKKKRGTLDLLVVREGKPQKITVAIPYLGAHSRTCPLKCKKCRAIAGKGLAWLQKHQQGGAWEIKTGGNNGSCVVASLGGLAFLASGSTPSQGPFREEIQDAAKYVTRSLQADEAFGGLSGGGTGANWNQENWKLGYAPLLLCEVYARRPTEKLRDALLYAAGKVKANQETTGGYAHGPGGPNALGYVELEIMSNYVVASMGCLDRVGIPVDQECRDAARDYIVACSTPDGGVAYSTRPGQAGMGDPGRSAGAVVAFGANGWTDHEMYPKFAGYLHRNLGGLPEGHVSPVMHLLAAAMASHLLGPEAWKDYWTRYRTFLMAARRPDGSFSAIPTEESNQLHSNSDRSCGPAWVTASYTLILLIPEDNLPVLLPRGSRKPVELPPVITEGEGESGPVPTPDPENPEGSGSPESPEEPQE